jgi:hypothetical protein
MPTFNTDGLAGVNILEVSSTPGHTLGVVTSLSDGGEAIYVQALSEISAYAYAVAYGDGTAQMATTTLAGTCKRGGWAQVSIPSAYYGWLQLSGKPKGNLAANCDDNVPLYTTATSGVLDDTTVSGVGGMVFAAISTVTISNATAVTLLVGRGQGVITGIGGS